MKTTSPFNCIIIGEGSLPIQCGSLLLEKGHGIRAVITTDPALGKWAKSHHIRCCASLEGGYELLEGDPVDYLFSINNLLLLPERAIELPRKGVVNYHDGPLPRYAGIHTPSWAIINGEKQHGISWHVVEAGVDTGAILKQELFEIAENESAYSLNLKCYEAAIRTFSELVTEIDEGTNEPRPQDLSRRSYFGMFKRPAGAATISWHKTAAHIDAMVRALDFGPAPNPLGRAKLHIGSEFFICPSVEVVEKHAGAEPGTLQHLSAEKMEIAVSEGAIAIASLLSLDGAPELLEEVASRHGLQAGSRLPDLGEPLVERITSFHEKCARHEAFWVRRLQSLSQPFVPYADLSGGEGRGNDYASAVMEVPADVMRALSDEFASGSVPDLLLSAFAVFIARLGGDTEFDLGINLADLRDDMSGLGGLFSTVVPCRIAIDEQKPFHEQQARIRQSLESLKEHLTFIREVRMKYPEFEPAGEGGRAGETTVQVARVDSLEDFTPSGSPHVCLVVADGESRCRWLFDPQLLSRSNVELMVNQFQTLLRGIAGNPGAPVSTLPLLNDTQKHEQLIAWNDTATPLPKIRSIHEAFEKQASATPDTPAVVFDDRELSFGEINARANQLARHLQKLGVGPDKLVGLCVRRTEQMVIALLGILKAGGAYVPLDPTYPKERISFMLQDSDAHVLVTEQEFLGLVPDHGARLVCIDTAAEAIDREDDGNLESEVEPHHLAYVIYTSGSTGKPKGVLVEHRNVINFFEGMDRRVETSAESRLLAVTSLSFDISVLEIFWTLTRGVGIVIFDGERTAMAGHAATPGSKGSSQALGFSLFYFSADQGENPDNKYRLLIEGARFGDEHGFDAVWTPERHFHDFGGLYPNPSVTGAGLATITRNVQIRSGSVVAPLHSPVRIAEEWSVVDNLSNGRVGLSFASGWMPEDFVIKPESFAEKKEIMFRNMETVRKLWRGESVPLPGPLGEDVEVKTLPRPIQSELPVWVTTAGNPETYVEAARHGAYILTHLLGQSIEEVAEKIVIYRKAWKEAGHPGRGHISLMLHTFVGDSLDTVRESVREPLTNYLRTSAGLIKKYSSSFPTFKQSGKSVEEANFGDLPEDELDALLEHAFNRYFETSGLFGTPESCVAITDKIKAHDVDEIACLIDFGVSADLVLDNLKHLSALRASVVGGAAASTEQDSIPALIRRHAITHLQCTPSMASMLLVDEDNHPDLATLKKWMIGGEAFPAALAEEVQGIVKGEVINMYGPTETTIWSTTHHLNGTTGQVSIGRPIANTEIYIVDRNLQPVPVGVPGELLIGGAGVVRGYLNRGELTRERFIENHFSTDPEARLYRTGDLARYTVNGAIEFIARMDHQVKIRGHRIELGEIEAAINDHPAVREAVVVARDAAGGSKQLAAFIVGEAGKSIGSAELREFLSHKLPDFMVPAHFVEVEAFPQTPNKKTDRKALANRKIAPPSSAPAQASATATTATAPPATSKPHTPETATPDRDVSYEGADLERDIAEIWCQELGLEQIDLNADFFELGGDSLSAVRTVVAISRKVGTRVPIQALLEAPTVATLTARLGGTPSGIRQATMTEAADASAAVRTETGAPERGETPAAQTASPQAGGSQPLQEPAVEQLFAGATNGAPDTYARGRDGLFSGGIRRLLQMVARMSPGATSLRPRLHRWRGVKMGKNVWIGYDAVIETSNPELVTIGDNVVISFGAQITAHFLDTHGVVLEDDVFIGPSAIVLPNTRIGRGSVVTAGSVVSGSVPPMTLMQGNPAVPIAKTGMPLMEANRLKDFLASLAPLD